MNFNIPKKLKPMFSGKYRYIILYGGRGGTKTHAICEYCLIQGMLSHQTILITREYQSSIKDSTYSELKNMIYQYNLTDFYEIKHDTIVGKKSYNCNTKFIFKGLARDINTIKSTADIDICFVEEADTIKAHDWDVLIPTVRKAGSQIIIAFNPVEEQSDTYQRFVINTPPDSLCIEINYLDNPFLSDTALAEIEYMKQKDYAKYEHIYLGKPISMTEDVVFKGHFKIDNVDIIHNTRDFLYKQNKVYPLYGLDFGFSTDPTAIIEVFLLDNDIIYINREIYEHKLLITKYAELIKQKMPEAINKRFYCDSARPDSIAQLNHDGLTCEGATKSKGSIEAGIEYLKGKQIIVNPNCKNMIYELYNYKYKIDKNTSQITTDIIDANNHLIDALRYALYKQISEAKKPLNALYNNPNFWS
jgi:phage terminase large subunit